MSAFSPIAPRKALELVAPAGLGDVGQVLVDFAVAGLVKDYARLIETLDANGKRSEVSDCRIPRELWRRIVDEGKASEVWSIGTVRLIGSGLIGGTPAVTIIGIRFDDKTLSRVVGEHGGQRSNAAISPKASGAPSVPSLVD